MHKLLAGSLVCVTAAAAAVGAALGIVAALDATPEQPNVPLVHFPSSPHQTPTGTGSPPASESPSAPPSQD